MSEQDRLATNIFTALYEAWADQYGEEIESIVVRRKDETNTSNVVNVGRAN